MIPIVDKIKRDKDKISNSDGFNRIQSNHDSYEIGLFDEHLIKISNFLTFQPIEINQDRYDRSRKNSSSIGSI